MFNTNGTYSARKNSDKMIQPGATTSCTITVVREFYSSSCTRFSLSSYVIERGVPTRL